MVGIYSKPKLIQKSSTNRDPLVVGFRQEAKPLISLANIVTDRTLLWGTPFAWGNDSDGTLPIWARIASGQTRSLERVKRPRVPKPWISDKTP